MTRNKRVLHLQDTSFQYDHAEERLDNIQLTVHEGECVVVTGPSGSGKTTLTRLVNGLIPHFYEGNLSGEVILKDKLAGQIQPWEFGKFVGSVFQDSRSQFFASLVEEEIAFAGENYGIGSEALRDRVDRLAREAGIVHLLQQEVRLLSSGEKQKVAVASACLMDSGLLVMDEPSANLDMAAARQLAERLAMLKANGKSLLIAEHRLYYLLPIADRIVYMRGGEMIVEWTPEELMQLSPEQLVQYGLRSPSLYALPVPVRREPSDQVRLSLEQVAVSPGQRGSALLQDISFAVNRGGIIAVTGANGAGKTTMAKTICGLLKQRRGTIALDGVTSRAADRVKKVWFVLQDSDYQLFSDTVLNELLLTHEKDQEASRRAERLLQALDLWSFRDRHPASLSGGQKQRVTLAVGLMRQPDVLVLDEPTSGLDGNNMRRVVHLLRQAAADGMAVLVITHDVEFVLEACDRMLFLSDRRLKADMPVTNDNRHEIVRLMEYSQVT